MTDTELQIKINRAIGQTDALQVWDSDRVYMDGFYSFQDLIKITSIITANRSKSEEAN